VPAGKGKLGRGKKIENGNPFFLRRIKPNQDAGEWNTEERSMNYWTNISREVREILAERPNVAAYANKELFSQWVRNLPPSARGVICNVSELRGSEFCAL
jgi:hypothetical protein